VALLARHFLHALSFQLPVLPQPTFVCPRATPGLVRMRVSVVTLGGRELASMSLDGAATKQDICGRIPGLVGPLLRAARLLYGCTEMSDGQSLDAVRAEDGALLHFVFDQRGGDLLLTASRDATAKIWRPASAECVHVLAEHEGPCTSAASSPDGEFVATASRDSTAKLWCVEAGRCLATFRGHLDAVWCVAVSPDGTLVATASEDATAKLWTARDGVCRRTLSGHRDGLATVAFSPDGAAAITTSFDNTAKVWRVSTGVCESTFSCAWSSIRAAEFSAAGAAVATVSDATCTALWQLDSRVCERTVSHGAGRIVAFSSNGAKALAVNDEGSGSVLDSATGNRLCPAPSNVAGISAAAFSLDATHVATGSTEGIVQLWRASSGRSIRRLWAHKGPVVAVAFSPPVRACEL